MTVSCWVAGRRGVGVSDAGIGRQLEREDVGTGTEVGERVRPAAPTAARGGLGAGGDVRDDAAPDPTFERGPGDGRVPGAS